jgi:hypothetical protein
MATLRTSHKGHTVRRLMIAPGMLALITGLSSMAYAQSERSGSRFEEARVDENQARLVAPIEGTWIQKVLPAGAPAPFIALVSFAAGGVTEATGTADRYSPFASAAAPQSILVGSWRQSDNNTTGPDIPGAERRIRQVYVSTLSFFSFDTEGNALYMYKNYITYWLIDYNTIEGRGNSVKCDIDGTHCAPYSSITISGTRLIAQGASN